MKKMTIDDAKGQWFEKWFDSSFYQKLYAHRDEKEAGYFVNELVALLNPRQQACILDLGCGNGRHSKCLASKGFDVTGIDLAASGIQEAKRYESPRLRFLRRDMRIPFGKTCFDYVFSFFSSFGYFTDPSDDEKVIENIAGSLKPGGIVMMDYINPCYAESHLVASEQKEIDGIIYHITRWSDELFLYKRIRLEENFFGTPIEYTEMLRKFSPEDFLGLFSRHHLQITKVFGNYSLEHYNKQGSERMILLANKIS